MFKAMYFITMGSSFVVKKRQPWKERVEGGCVLMYYPIRYDILHQVDVLMQAEVKVTKASCIMWKYFSKHLCLCKLSSSGMAG